MNDVIRLAQTVEAGGCSAKLSPKALEEILREVPLPSHPNIIVGASTHDDAGILRLPSGEYLVQTTDFFPPMVDYPYDFGQVAAANALSDVYAMGGRPICALSLVMFPSQHFPSDVLVSMLKGAADKVAESDAYILGGHTIDDHPIKFGLAVSGLVDPDRLVTNSGANPGDKLILTKPLGTSILTGARKVDLITEEEVRPAVESMCLLNRSGAERMNEFDIKGATDVTGFGLLGHAYRFANASGVSFRIESRDLPVLPGALDLIDQGVIPGGCMRNLDFVRERVAFLPSLTANRKWLALDPQTSGGLLMSAPSGIASDLLTALQNNGLTNARIIGEVHPPGNQAIQLA